MMIGVIVFSIILNLFIGNFFLADITARDGRLMGDEEITISVPSSNTVEQDNNGTISPLTEPSEDPVPPFPPSG
ncbi:MAG: hypothetical protein OEZ30_01840 [Candidatus Aminicenantes bacterium]|nr:hypothetical protein [Candidatus Aminicenantes bacterium]MDH5714287.1 hypothetical protein [Candidatus Aminicenantes bacterium]